MAIRIRLSNLLQFFSDMHQTRLHCTNECNEVEHPKMSHGCQELDESELHSSPYNLHGPVVLHFGGQQRECKLLVVVFQQKESSEHWAERVDHEWSAS